jgi:hypothetical protein
MPAGSRTLLASGKRRISVTGRRVLSNASGPCCCGPCDPDSNVCENIECTSARTSLCCWQCDDTVSVDFGDITASGTGTVPWIETAVGLMIPVVENQTVTVKLKEVNPPVVSDLIAVFEWYSGELGRDATHVYGVMIDAKAYQWTGIPAPAVAWLPSGYVWRVALSDWAKSGPCQNIELAEVLTVTPWLGIPPAIFIGTCCGNDQEMTMQPTVDSIASVDPTSNLISSTMCDQVCDCDELPSSLLVEADCITGTVNRASGDCNWSGSASTGSIEECDLVETSILVRHSDSSNGADENFCGWVVEIGQDIYGLVGEDCTIIDTLFIVAYKVGGGPTGAYTVFSGTGCGTEIEVS